MPIPLLPFVAGAAAGGLAMYLYKDEERKARIRERTADLADKISARMRGKQAQAADNDASAAGADIQGEAETMEPPMDDRPSSGGASV